ncbi:hypothetical protein ACJZ2D_004028 [Fusarium nematophilum]
MNHRMTPPEHETIFSPPPRLQACRSPQSAPRCHAAPHLLFQPRTARSNEFLMHVSQRVAAHNSRTGRGQQVGLLWRVVEISSSSQPADATDVTVLFEFVSPMRCQFSRPTATTTVTQLTLGAQPRLRHNHLLLQPHLYDDISSHRFSTLIMLPPSPPLHPC